MQSVLQYRSFRSHASNHFQRDTEKLDSIPIPPSDGFPLDSSANSSVTPRNGTRDLRDVEKGEHIPVVGDALSETIEQEPTLAPTLIGIEIVKHQDLGEVFVVGFSGDDDPLNPHNWSKVYRVWATLLVASIAFIVGWASSIDSGALAQASEDFGVSQVTESLAAGIYLIGFGVGALFSGPFSETVGRNPVYIVTMTLYMVFIMAAGLAPNIGAQLAFRFLAGLFGSTPLTCAGGTLADLWSPMERVYMFPVFANAAFMGPILGPVAGGWIGQSSHISWRWTEWVTLIGSGVILTTMFLTQRETYAPVLLKWKAEHIREVTGDERYKSALELRGESFWYRLRRALYRPFVLTIREPIVMVVTLYLTVVYIVLFTFLNSYAFIFTDTYNFSQGLTGTAFIGIGIGLCLSSLLVPIIYRWSKEAKAKQEAAGNYGPLPPEFRLWFAMFGAPALPISLFWMGWTNYSSISPWSGLGASVLFGYSILCIFISCYQYIIDSYEAWAASALAFVTLIRYIVAGSMVEVALPMYGNLGVHWALTLLGCLGLLLVPVPYVFYKAGPWIRSKSKYAKGRSGT